MAGSCRDFIPKHNHHPIFGAVDLSKHDVYSWVEFGLQHEMIAQLWGGWQKLYAEEYRGITTNGQIVPNLYELRCENAPTAAMVEKAECVLALGDKFGISDQMRYPVDAAEWRCWQNPEFCFHRTGVRLEEQADEMVEAILELVRASLSEKGYKDVAAVMKTNAFLGRLVGARKLMNERSYNFILFGKPSLTEPWGWSIWGHHLTFCIFVVGEQMVVSPVFRGCEPNVIDHGEDCGVEMFVEEMQMATDLLRTLTTAERRDVVVYDRLEHPDMPVGFPHPADGRNLAGAYEDNKVILPSGGQVSQWSMAAQDAFLKLVATFIDFLPEGSLAAKMSDVKRHLEDTWMLWMGGYGDEDVFHFRIQGPVLLCEFDHECGIWLTNRTPGRFHIHTIVRSPNGNDYGRSLLRLWREKY